MPKATVTINGVPYTSSGATQAEAQANAQAFGNTSVAKDTAAAAKSSSGSSGAIHSTSTTVVGSPTSKSPAVITSAPAKKQVSTIIQPAYNDAKAGIDAQEANLATQKIADQQAQSNIATSKLDDATKQAKLEEIKQKALLIQKELNDNGTAPDSTKPNVPPGWDATTYANFKQANPDLEPTAEDTQKMSEASSQQDELTQEKASLDQANKEYYDKADAVSKSILNIQNGVVPLSSGEKAQVQGLQQQFNALIQQQQQINTSASGVANVRGYQTGSAEYDPNFQIKTIGSIVTAGNNKVADLNVKMASAVADLEQSFKDNNIAAIKDSFAIFKDASDARRTALQDTIKDTQAAIKDAQDRQDKVTDKVNAIAEELAKNGAPADVITAASAAGSEAAAIAAGAGYFQDPTSTGGQYQAYANATRAKGLTPMLPGDWVANQKYREAYSSAKGSAQAAADIAGVTADATGNAPDPTATGITGATGLSLQAFNYLTQGTPSMSRMSAAQRNQIIAEANSFLNKNGIDVSTFQSQYKAYNDVLQHNLERANNTKIFAGEITGTVDQFANDIGDDFGSLKVGNVAKLLAGQEVNDPTVQKYAFDLQTMQNDLAGYYAASRTGGSNATPDDSDKRAAAEVIKNGINGGSAAAFKQSITDNEQKVTKVVNDAATSAQKQVWDLFGVGSQFKAKVAQVDPKQGVDTYVASNPIEAINVANLYEVPGTNDQDVYDYLVQAGKITQ